MHKKRQSLKENRLCLFIFKYNYNYWIIYSYY